MKLEKLQKANFDHLKKRVEHQISVRRGEIEGMMYDIKKDLNEIYAHRLIDMQQLDELLNMLERTYEDGNS